MKRFALSKKGLLFVIFLSMASIVFSGCGSATEVGNPIGSVPITINGVIDISTLPEDALVDVSASWNAADYTIDPTSLTVVATATDDSDEEEAPVSSDGSFSIEVYDGRTYAFDVYSGETIVGDFSFEEDDFGNRGNRLRVSGEGGTISLGTVRFEDGTFVPQHEPRRQMGQN